MKGYWMYDWSDATTKVTKIDTATKRVTLQYAGQYGLRKGQPYYAFNALNELDTAEEYYLDRDSGILYFWPGEPLTEQSSIVVSTTNNLMRGTSPSNIAFEDLILEGNVNNNELIIKPPKALELNFIFRQK